MASSDPKRTVVAETRSLTTESTNKNTKFSFQSRIPRINKGGPASGKIDEVTPGLINSSKEVGPKGFNANRFKNLPPSQSPGQDFDKKFKRAQPAPLQTKDQSENR